MPSDLVNALDIQRAAFLAELPVPMAARKDRIRRLVAVVRDNANRFADALAADFGHRSRDQSLMSDVVAVTSVGKHTLAHMDRWARPEKRRLPCPLGLLGASARIEYQPKGVVGVIGTWNFPVQLTVAPAIGALAAGNRCMIKGSEIVPATTELMRALIAAAFDPSELIVFGGGPDAGKAFAGLPFDHIIFTGAGGIARHILHAAADNLVPVTLELGGKSPAIIGKDADIGTAMTRIATGKMMNAGQICLAPDYVLTPADREPAVIDAVKSAVGGMYPTLLNNPDYTSIVNERHHVRLQSYLEDAREKGAEVIEVNPGGEDFTGANVNKMPLYIVRNATDEMKVLREEIFGPILPVRRYSAIGEAIDYINARDRPLGVYYFGTDQHEQRQVLDRTVSGGVTINDVMFHAGMDDLPFGGIGPSGMGAYHGIDGFRTFSHAKSIYRQGRLDIGKLGGMRPPYGAAARSTIARGLKS